MVDIKAVREALVAIQTDRLGALVQSALDEGLAAKDILDPGHMQNGRLPMIGSPLSHAVRGACTGARNTSPVDP